MTQISYSLGDAIDWKPKPPTEELETCYVSYSLGDAIDWKLNAIFVPNQLAYAISYSLGDAIDWKQLRLVLPIPPLFLLLARGRDRLETYQILN